MKILITGANGQVGQALTQRLTGSGEIVALDRHSADLSQPEHLRAVLDANSPDWIINAAAYTAVDKAESEPELAFTINAQAPKMLAEWAAAHGAKLVHYSTDYVFDGTKVGAYVESDAPAPLNAYGASKLTGEQAIAAVAGVQTWVFRTTWVFAAHGNNFLKTMLKLAQTRESLSVVNDQFGAPTSADLIADVTATLIDKVQGGLGPTTGLYHLAAAGETHWQAYAQHVLRCAQARGEVLNIAPEQVAGIPARDYPTPAARPANSRLDTTKLEREFDMALPDWRVGVETVVNQLKA
ncbi:dTDP-4-dehydrorhamnose reductase [Paraperlucidibaca baekdonensis]|uniref:dTDP-4-dehydrorhamnose reductase n=1 Tax=Paraperlucidibaca baekdonensis TaxID=748120 RepID=A0A3E0H9I6_9GAMM|nr:dTDP-4-dehydrorhamnose reductase [Paraperlucidibaca baekdonensis]REH40371.1 dTDP-4-dehydrorhamnose reductase [Paraperlucidibaca baekdonensis]